MWNIEIKHKASYNCFQNIIYSIADYYNTSYAMMMLELWGFSYSSKKGSTIGQKLSLPWFGNLTRRNELLEKYHGFGFNSILKEKGITGEIDNQLLLSPVGIYLDACNCDWLPFYGKQHREHICLIIGIVKDEYIIVDETCIENKTFNMSKQYIDKQCKAYIEFHTTNSQGSYILNEGIADLIHNVDSNYMFEQYNQFADDMVNRLNLEFELTDQEDPITSRLVMLLKNISQDRVNFIESLVYIENNSNHNFEKQKIDLVLISQIYEKIRAYLIRCMYLKRKPDNTIIQTEFIKIIDAEKRIYENLKNVI